jgi:ADP-heptose:LPS heptosyltransferase
MMYSSGASPLRGRYLVRNPALYAALRAGDAMLEVFGRSRSARPIAPPRRLLVAIGGHLGDAVIATSVLPVLARRFPEAQIGMVLPSWAEPVVRGHPSLRWVHSVDHWRTSRANDGLTKKWRHYRASRARSIAELREIGYDVAVDLYPYFPNMATVLWRAGIPERIGYRSGGNGSLYTRGVDWIDTREHTAAQHLRMLGELDPEFRARLGSGPPRYDLPPISEVAADATVGLLASFGVAPGAFVVVHPGVGSPLKAWPTDRWRELAKRLSDRGLRLVFTGAGAAESSVVGEIAAVVPNAVNLCGRLDWITFRVVIERARLAIGVDSVAMHLAAASNTPCVTIMAGMSDPLHWRPLGDRVEVVTHAVTCAPCFQSAGCATMGCVRDVSVDDVLKASNRLLELD